MSREALIEAMARALCANDYGKSYEDADMPFNESYCEDAEVALSAIEAAGYVVVPRESYGAVSELIEAARAVLASWDRNTFEREKFVPASGKLLAPGYWAPHAAFVNSEQIAALRAALNKLENGNDA